MKKLILAIETSCDETSLALVEASGGLRNLKFRVLKNLVSSQIPVHRPFGGVVPNLAKREHIKNLPILLKKLNPKPYTPHPDLIAVTVGPGLEPALWAGIEFAKALGKKLNVPVLGANHMEGHLYSFLLSQKVRNVRGSKRSNDSNKPSDRTSNVFPAIALIVSGGHTILLLLKNLTTWKKLGETRDDAAGEAFDKVARLLGLPYPGGPEIEKISLRQAQGAHPMGTIDFPRPMMHQKNYDFSFSGLKTSVLYYLRDTNIKSINIFSRSRKDVNIADIAASFQQAVVDVLTVKTMRAVKEFEAKSVILCGGVAANRALRAVLGRESKKAGARFLVPDFEYNTDNAAMIAVAGYLNFLQKKRYKLIARGDLNI